MRFEVRVVLRGLLSSRQAVRRLAVDTDKNPTVSDLHDVLAGELADGLAGTDRPSSGHKQLVIDGQLCEAGWLLSDCPLYEGAEIGLPEDTLAAAHRGQPNRNLPDRPPNQPNRPPNQPKSALVVVGGLECAAQTSFGFYQTVVGRHRSADLQLDNPAISLRHLLLYGDPQGKAFICDLDSANPVRLESSSAGLPPVTLGSGGQAQFRSGQRIFMPGAVLEWRQQTSQPSAQSPSQPPGTRSGPPPKILFQRSSRPQPPDPEPPLQLPDLDARQSQLPLRSLGWATFVVPLGMGLLLAMLFSPYMALFALLGPAMAVASWLEGRGNAKKEGKRRRRKFRHILVECDDYYYATAAKHQQRQKFEHPDPPATLDWALAGSRRLWSLRLDDSDFLRLAIGRHSLRWRPPVQIGGQPRDDVSVAPDEARHHRRRGLRKASKPNNNLVLADEITRLFDSKPALEHSCAVVDFFGATAAVVGPEAEAVLRWIVLQAACRYGPADLRLVVVGATQSQLSGDWEWLDWLPHVEHYGQAGRQGQPGQPGQTSQPEPPTASTGHSWLIFLRPPGQLGALPDGVSALILAGGSQELPPGCEVSIETADALGRGQLVWSAGKQESVWLDGISSQTALAAARGLARLEDPLKAQTSQATIGQVSLAELLGIDDPSDFSARQLVGVWADTDRPRGFAVPIGRAGGEVAMLDLPSEGPHVLIAGTTGSGKSELLRCIVASLALRVEPARLNFVLIDYKGGSAFDVCSQLPHVVGLVTDLDEHLGERALTCLRAELAYRERFLRRAGVSDVADLAPDEPGLARLVVMVDEFASLANELPSFLESLVGIAQRGRSLGMHLLLATQRPAGVVSAEIRSNTNIRIGLRMLDEMDSQDVLGTAEAAHLSQDQPGRGYVKAGAEAARLFQVASVSGVTRRSGTAPVELCPLQPAEDLPVYVADADEQEKPETDLARFVKTAQAAHELLGAPELRCPWPDPLPHKIDFQVFCEQLPRAEVADVEGADQGAIETAGKAPGADGTNRMAVPLGLADLPESQTQRYFFWQPGESNLFFLGLADSGAKQSFLSTTLLLCRTAPATQLHLHGLDFGTAGLSKLNVLPHLGTLAGQSDPQKCLRLLDYLVGQLTERQTGHMQQLPKLVLLIDNLGAVLHFLEETREFQRMEKFIRLLIDGPTCDISTLATAESPSAVPRRMLSGAGEQLLFQMSDSSAHMFAASGAGAVPKIAGRALLASSGVEIQTAHLNLDRDLARAQSGQGCPPRGPGHPPKTPGHPPEALPKRIAPIPDELLLADFAPEVAATPSGAEINLGLAHDHVPVGLKFAAGQHAIVCGRDRTGKTSTLRLLAQLLAGQDMQTVALCPGGSALAQEPGLVAWANSAGELLARTETSVRADRPVWLLLDDLASFGSNLDELLSLLLKRASGGFHLVAAADPEILYAADRGWLKQVLACRTGVLLSPEESDLNLFGTDGEPARDSVSGVGFDFGANTALGGGLGRDHKAHVPKGRALVVNDGHARLCQLAKPQLQPQP